MLRSQTQWSATENSTKDINYLDSNEAQSSRKVELSMSHLWPCKFAVQEFVKIR